MDYFYKQTEHGFEIVIADSLENYTALFTVATKDDGQSALKVLIALQAQLATAHAAREAAEAEVAEYQRVAQQMKPSTLYKYLHETADKIDSLRKYTHADIKVGESVIGSVIKNVEALQAENARLKEVAIELKDSLASNYHDFYHKARKALYSLELDTTPPATESARYVARYDAESSTRQVLYGVWDTVSRRWWSDSSKHWVNFITEEAAQALADELNANES